MDSKTEYVMVEDCNTIANGIMRDINDIDAMERMLGCELTCEDLFRIDSAILSSLRETTDFSRDLLRQLEEGSFERKVHTEERINTSTDDVLAKIQKDTIVDITMPLQNMFDEMVTCISNELVS